MAADDPPFRRCALLFRVLTHSNHGDDRCVLLYLSHSMCNPDWSSRSLSTVPPPSPPRFRCLSIFRSVVHSQHELAHIVLGNQALADLGVIYRHIHVLFFLLQASQARSTRRFLGRPSSSENIVNQAIEPMDAEINRMSVRIPCGRCEMRTY
jgi:hypothetical protein